MNVKYCNELGTTKMEEKEKLKYTIQYRQLFDREQNETILWACKNLALGAPIRVPGYSIKTPREGLRHSGHPLVL